VKLKIEDSKLKIEDGKIRGFTTKGAKGEKKQKGLGDRVTGSAARACQGRGGRANWNMRPGGEIGRRN
jgi:hypothetical protein